MNDIQQTKVKRICGRIEILPTDEPVYFEDYRGGQYVHWGESDDLKALAADHTRLADENAKLTEALQALIDREYMVSPSWSGSAAREAVIANAQVALDSISKGTEGDC